LRRSNLIYTQFQLSKSTSNKNGRENDEIHVNSKGRKHEQNGFRDHHHHHHLVKELQLHCPILVDIVAFVPYQFQLQVELKQELQQIQ
jgi:hypothetical protein